MRVGRAIRVLLSVWLAGLAPAGASSNSAFGAPPPAAGPFPPEVQEIVALLALAPLLEGLRDRPSEPELAAPDGPESVAAVLRWQVARSEVESRILAAALQADQVIAALAEEQANLLEMQAWLEARQRASTTTLNLAVGILSAGTAVGTGLTISDRTARAGAVVGTVAGILGAGAALLAARAPGPSRPPITVSSLMLAPFFGQPPSSSYPPVVWRYLAAAPPGAAQTRREQLLTAWRVLGRLPSEGTAVSRDKITQLAGPISSTRPISADVVSDRIRMLADVRAQSSSLKSALSRTLVAIHADGLAEERK